MKYFTLLMSVLYVLVGSLFLFTQVLEAQVTNLRIPLGVLLVGYGVVRAYLWRRKYADATEGD